MNRINFIRLELPRITISRAFCTTVSNESVQKLDVNVLRDQMKDLKEKIHSSIAEMKKMKRAYIEQKKSIATYRKTLQTTRKHLASLKSKKLLPRPQKLTKLCTSPSMLYASEKIKKDGIKTTEAPLTRVHRLRNEFKTLSDETKAIYEEQAAANRKTRALKRAELRGMRMTPYALFVQDQYRTVSMSIPGSEGPKKMSLVGKALSERWASLTAEERAVYRDRASAIRSAAVEHA